MLGWDATGCEASLHLGNSGAGDSPEGRVHTATKRAAEDTLAGRELSISGRWAWPAQAGQSAELPLRQTPRPGNPPKPKPLSMRYGPNANCTLPARPLRGRVRVGLPWVSLGERRKSGGGSLAMGELERRCGEVPHSRGVACSRQLLGHVRLPVRRFRVSRAPRPAVPPGRGGAADTQVASLQPPVGCTPQFVEELGEAHKFGW